MSQSSSLALLDAVEVSSRAIVRVDLDARGFHLGAQLRQERRRDIGVDQERLHGVAHAGALHFRIERDLKSHLGVGGTVDKDVTHTFVVLDDRNSCVLGDEPNQSFSTSRDDHVQNTIKTNHHQSRLSIRGGQKCDGLGRQAFVPRAPE